MEHVTATDSHVVDWFQGLIVVLEADTALSTSWLTKPVLNVSDTCDASIVPLRAVIVSW